MTYIKQAIYYSIDGGEKMNKKMFSVFVSFMAVAMLTLPMSMVFAKNNPKFIDVSGNLTALGTAPPVFTPVGNSDQVKITVTGNSLMWGGSFEDSISIADSRWVAHPGVGKITGYTIHIMTANFDSKSGTLTIASASGHWRIIAGTGDFVNCRGQGTITTVTAPFLYYYEGQIHYDP
jgi:hypothetical protein